MKKKITMLALIPWMIMLVSVFVCEACIPPRTYDVIRDLGKSCRTNGRNNYGYSCIGNKYEVAAVPLTAGRKVVQTITVDASMLKDDQLVLGMVFGTYSRLNQGGFSVRLEQRGGWSDYQYSMEELSDLEIYPMVFSTADILAGELRITLWSDDGTDDNCVAVMLGYEGEMNNINKDDINNYRHSKESSIFGETVIDGVMQQSTLLMELYTR